MRISCPFLEGIKTGLKISLEEIKSLKHMKQNNEIQADDFDLSIVAIENLLKKGETK